MMKRVFTRRLVPIFTFLLFSVITIAQPADEVARKENKPYRILTSGKQVTVKSTKNIRSIMVWTSTGHRIVEQRDVNAASYTFNVNSTRDRIFFVMLQYDGSRSFTEKIGVQ